MRALLPSTTSETTQPAPLVPTIVCYANYNSITTAKNFDWIVPRDFKLLYYVADFRIAISTRKLRLFSDRVFGLVNSILHYPRWGPFLHHSPLPTLLTRALFLITLVWTRFTWGPSFASYPRPRRMQQTQACHLGGVIRLTSNPNH